ncbi:MULTISPECIES: DJ-1/PfpI family protein [unclassified Arthrobacter]|uniref:GlxA family transcriptional regulator n=1 Tax=unclassified Arthrobacter TaxID=235627 RepID=UPI001E55C996|nr:MULTISPECIES: DJ-1/PfpI family protein [unclassified Arthrobacter]MCC9146523.1 DJ-1/PfpI family protein [Arthrobacter sp. zg-Y919]MDK1277753.1 DJ-1/PfpI family protein [Arthrobacter sp. zg.Y919]MDM7989747.1 DJ-1/PfpI family protein [Arthrobacter sp. zg-Y877]WIB02292.1 DJ-1/PfpI family protein [Arthrobacter sp. zg-Y919]
MLHSVAVIVLDGTAPFEFSVLAEVFGIDRSQRGGGVPAFDFRLCTPEPGLVSTKAGFSIAVDAGLEAAADADLVVMAPGGDYAGETDARVLEVLRSAYGRGAWVMSICTGAFRLAEAGLLDGRRATTHWMYSADMAARYPAVQVDEDVLYVQDGTVITSAGTAAGIDAALHLVRITHGAKTAAAIARDMVVPPHRDGGQAQYIDRAVPAGAGDTLEPVLEWIGEHLAQEHSVKDLASRAAMSPRTFARRFRAETGTTPAAWINAQRVLYAQELLEDTDLTVEEVARAAGFGQPELLRHHFHRDVGASPAAYRRTFRGRSVPQPG